MQISNFRASSEATFAGEDAESKQAYETDVGNVFEHNRLLPKTVSESIYTDVTARSMNNKSPWSVNRKSGVAYEPLPLEAEAKDESYIRMKELQKKLENTAREISSMEPEKNLQEYLYPVKNQQA